MSKLSDVMIGPYTILEKIGTHAFKLDFPDTIKIHPVVHVSLIQKYHPNTIAGRIAPPPPPIMIANERAFETEEILKSRKYYSQLQYLIKWKGYDVSNNSWEPASDPLVNPEEYQKEQEFHLKNPHMPH